MVERYTLVKKLPSGGFGNVAVYFDSELDREVVIKSLIHPSPENRERFMREATILSKLHPHEQIVGILGSNFYAANPYIILEYCRCGTLQDWVTNSGLWGPSEINVAYAIQHAAVGLNAIHNLGGFHRDIKPANLFIGNDKWGQLTIKVGDFGFSRLPYPHSLGGMTRHAFGTVGYIAPELYRRDAQFTKTCDIYSLGITGIELLTASRNRESIKSAWIINSELKSLLLRMTSTDPANRPSALEVVTAVKNNVEKKHNENLTTAVFGGLALVGLGLLIASSESTRS